MSLVQKQNFQAFEGPDQGQKQSPERPALGAVDAGALE